MAQATWEKSKVSDDQKQKVKVTSKAERYKFMIGGFLILGAVIFLVISGTLGGARYFITVDEVVNNPDYIGETVRVSGAVLGDSIVYDEENLIMDFVVADMPTEIDDLAKVLHDAVNNPNTPRMQVHIENQVKPDLLQHEAQAIMTGHLGEDGIFYVDELLLKCPSRYEEALPEQVAGESGVSEYAG